MSSTWDDAAYERWVTLADAADAAGVSRSTLRSWYRTDQVASRLVPGPNGPQREVPLDQVLERARLSDRLGRGAAEALAGQDAPPASGHEACVAAIAALEAALRRAEERAERAESALLHLLADQLNYSHTLFADVQSEPDKTGG